MRDGGLPAISEGKYYIGFRLKKLKKYAEGQNMIILHVLKSGTYRIKAQNVSAILLFSEYWIHFGTIELIRLMSPKIYGRKLRWSI
jgi:hypothetical protein